MAYTSKNGDPQEYGYDTPTVSRLAQPSGYKQNPDNSYGGDPRRNRDGDYESMRRNNDDGQQISRRDQSRYVPNANINVNPTRRGGSRTCVLEINIDIGSGGGRAPQGSFTTNNFSSNISPARSTTIIDGVHHIDLNFQAPNNTAQLSTDGIIRSSSSNGGARQ